MLWKFWSFTITSCSCEKSYWALPPIDVRVLERETWEQGYECHTSWCCVLKSKPYIAIVLLCCSYVSYHHQYGCKNQVAQGFHNVPPSLSDHQTLVVFFSQSEASKIMNTKCSSAFKPFCMHYNYFLFVFNFKQRILLNHHCIENNYFVFCLETFRWCVLATTRSNFIISTVMTRCTFESFWFLVSLHVSNDRVRHFFTVV